MDRTDEVENSGDYVPTASLIAGLAYEVGCAWRGDWSDFDGRTLRAQLDDLHRVASGAITPAEFRFGLDLCAAGKGHWRDQCDEACDIYEAEGRGDLAVQDET